MATFEYLRFSLSAPTTGGMFDEVVEREPSVSRREFLEYAFSVRRDFVYNRSDYTFVPTESFKLEPDILSGFIGRKVKQNVNAGPDDYFALTQSEHYRASFFAIDVSEGEQLAVLEKRGDVGNAERVLSALMIEAAKSFGKRTPWFSDVEYVSNPEDFWSAVEQHQGKLTKLEFEFHPANGLNGFDAWKAFDREFKKETNAQSSSYALKNKDGMLEPGAKDVGEAVEYASEGGGWYKLFSGRRVVFFSKNAKRTKNAPSEMMPENSNSPKISGLIDYLFRGGAG